MSHSFTLNGRTVEAAADLTPLLEVLRDEHNLQGAKLGCGEGRCGSCTVLVDDEPVAACIYPVAQVAGRNVRTVESLSPPGEPLTAVQDALLEHGGVQCGACIPGVVMTLTSLLESKPEVDAGTVQAALTGNICRCTGYVKIVEAAVAAANGHRGEQE